MAEYHLTYGLEEEVFITEPLSPSLQSMYYLAKLMWRDPAFYYSHTACNFKRGRDLRGGLMSSVEISTAPCRTPAEVVADLKKRRADLASASGGFLVLLGSLLHQEAPTNASGMHIHISGLADPDAAYWRLVHFLPLLGLLAANSPLAGGSFWGLSYRWANCFAIGPLREDREYRFQDMIFSKRLGTLEIRAFDPVWSLQRVHLLLEVIDALLRSDVDPPRELGAYNSLRMEVARHGYQEALRPLLSELQAIYPLPEEVLAHPPAEEVAAYWKMHGSLLTYAALDGAYRMQRTELGPTDTVTRRPRLWRVLGGLLFYYLPKIPYNIHKVLAEW